MYEEFRAVTMQCNHVEEEVCRVHVIEDGEEHGFEVPILDSISAVEIELWAERVAVGED